MPDPTDGPYPDETNPDTVASAGRPRDVGPRTSEEGTAGAGSDAPPAGDPVVAGSSAEQDGVEWEDLRLALSGLGALAASQMSLVALLEQVAGFAVQAIPGADGAGLTLLQQGKGDTIVATADFVRAVDDVQYSIGQGPCIQAAADGVTVRSGSLGEDPMWPQFGPAVAHLGVHSALSLPLVGPDGVLGAMNIYAHGHDVFDTRAAQLGQLYALPAAIAVQNANLLAQTQLLVTQLETALHSRADIDQAIGVLITRSGYTPAEAFTRLREISQRENRKLAAVAQTIVEQAARRARAQHSDN